MIYTSNSQERNINDVNDGNYYQNPSGSGGKSQKSKVNNYHESTDLLSKLGFISGHTYMSRVRGIGSNLMADGSPTATVNVDYYTLTLNKGTGISSVTGAATYLNNQTPNIAKL